MRAVLIVVLLELVAARTARAEDAAKRAFKEGAALFNRGDMVGAIEAFERAYRLRPHFVVQCNLARCYENRSEMVKAAAHYKRCLDEGAASGSTAAEVRASLAAVEAKITRVRVTSPREPAEIFLDGKERGQTPVTLLVDPGSHVVEARWRSGSARKGLTTRGGEAQAIVFEAIEASAAAAATQASESPQPAPRASRRRLHQAWFWTGVGLTAALTAVTAVLGAQTLSLRDDFDRNPTRASYDAASTRRLLTNVFLGCAIAAAGSTTTLFFFTDFSRERRGSTAAIGVQLGGTF